MIKYTKGNLLNADTAALVNTVNTVGVMGKGIALQFKNRFPHNYKVYRDACKSNTFRTGQVLVVAEGDLYTKKFIINFPTKEHWKGKSQYKFITSGLVALKKALVEHRIKSVAIPPLGCGNGGLDWATVRNMIANELSDVEAEIVVYEPNAEIKKVLQKENTSTNKAKLTPARAMLMYMMYAYESTGEQSSLFVANKLAYFLQRRGEKLRLKFEAHHYGPYAVQLNHVLLHLNGSYLMGMEQNEIKPFEPLMLNYEKLTEVQEYINQELKQEQKQRLKDVTRLLSRFESTFSLELLASVDFIMDNNKTDDYAEILSTIKSWNTRKANMFKSNQIEIAVNHLKNYKENLFEMA